MFLKGLRLRNTVWISCFFERSLLISLHCKIKIIFQPLFNYLVIVYTAVHYFLKYSLPWLLWHHMLLVPSSLTPFLLCVIQALHLLLAIEVWSFSRLSVLDLCFFFMRCSLPRNLIYTCGFSYHLKACDSDFWFSF